MKLAVVVAAYNEAESIGLLFERLEKVLAAMPAVTAEAVFVVEGTDGTHEILARRSAGLSWVRLLYSKVPSGLGAAFRRAFAAVAEDADYVVTLDADLNHQPEEIPRLVEAAVSRDCDILVGSRFVAGGEIVGTPLWKRALSSGVNRFMGLIYGLEVRDKTSGFRVYRASALRGLHFRSDAFAFLPELLIEARREGLRVEEEPIHFTYRRRGDSKMAFWPTSWSYLSMLARCLDRWRWAVLALFLVGLALRVGLTFPLGKLHSEADCALNGLCAFRVLRGETPVFQSHTRLGSVGAHLTAFLIFVGADLRTALVTGPLFISIALMGFWYLFLRQLVGRRCAAIALLFIAVPAPSFSFWTTMPNGYPEVMLLCGMTLWLAVVAARSRNGRWPFLGLGLAAGLGLWTSLQTLGCSAPAIVWLLWQRPRALASWAPPLVLGGFLLGAFPWLAFNLRYDLVSLRSGYAATATPGLAAKLDNAQELVAYKLPELVGSVDPKFWPRRARALRALHPLVLAVHLGAAALFFYLALRARKSGFLVSGRIASQNAPQLLFALVLVAMAALNVVSVAGMSRGVTVRYVLPLYLVIPGIVAVLILWIGARSRWLAGAVAGLLLTFNVAGTYLPWTVERGRWVRSAANDDLVLRFLDRKQVDAVLGDYWLVYPINYFSRERIKGIPFRRKVDHYRLERQLGDKPLRWAVLSTQQDGGDLDAWVERSGLAGALRRRRGYGVFVLRERVPAPEFLECMRKAYRAREREKHLEPGG